MPLQKKLELLRHFTEYMDDFLTEGELDRFSQHSFRETLNSFKKTQPFSLVREARSWLEYFTSRECKKQYNGIMA